MERLTQKHFIVTTIELYMRFRVERARERLLYSNASIMDISVRVGFSSASHFATWYRRIFGTLLSEPRADSAAHPNRLPQPLS
ncbi:MAG: helix-turn-helix domain-containing protein [Pseudomonadota bacterium]|nr:helix-turn-helix domain-containing protein [Pseudomonadota bacterium]